MLDGRREDAVAHLTAHRREHREVAAVEPREDVRVEDIARVRVRGESFQGRGVVVEVGGRRSVRCVLYTGSHTTAFAW